MASDKIVASVYKIDLEKFNELIDSNAKSFKDIVATIVTKNDYEKDWDLDRIGDNYVAYKTQKNPYSWGTFFSATLAEDHPLVKGKNQKTSFVMFIQIKKNMYSICAGVGFHIIKDFIEDHFGMEIFCRLFEKVDVEPNFLKFRGYTGKQLLGQIHFRQKHRLAYEDDFGKVYSEVVSRLEKEKAQEAFKQVKIDLSQDLSINAKDSIQIRKNLSLNEFLNLCIDLNHIYETQDANFSINKIKRIDSRDKSERKILEIVGKEILDLVTESLFGKSIYPLEFMSAKQPDFFLNSPYYEITERGHRNPTKVFLADELFGYFELIQMFREHDDYKNVKPEHKLDLCKQFLDTKITFEVQDAQKYIERVEDLVVGEIIVQGKKYFRIDKYWYQFDDEFEDYVNDEFKSAVVPRFKNALLRKRWPINLTKEEDFIAKNFDTDWTPLHTLKVNNVELCDLIKIDDENKLIYLAHVKDGVDAITRDVVSQAIIATRMLIEDRKSSSKMINDYLRVIQRKGQKFTGSAITYDQKLSKSCSQINLNNWRTAFKEYSVITCVCIRDDRKIEKELHLDFKSYESNIAKMSLVEYSKSFANFNLECHVIQIKQN